MTGLTLNADTAYARMRVIVTDAAGGALTRDGVAVRGASDVYGDRIVDDYECPFDQPVTYQLAEADATGTLPAPASGAVLTHPTDPTLAVYGLTVHSDDAWQWSAPGIAHNVIGSAWPVVTHGLRTVHEGTLMVQTAYDARAPLYALLQTGAVLLLRTPASCAVDDGWLWPQSVTGEKLGRRDDPSAFRWSLDYQRAQRPGGEVTQDPSNSWAALAVTHATWSDLSAAHATWSEVRLTAHPHD